MPISTTITSHKFLNQFTNLEGFSGSLSDFTENLAGVAIELQKAISTIEISWEAVASQSDLWTFTKNTPTDWTISRATGNFRTDGFWVGAYCRLETNNGLVSNVTIDTISNDGRIINVTADNSTIVADGSWDFFTLLPIASDASNSLTSLIYGFGIIGKGETYNNRSKVSGNEQKYYFTSLAVGGGAQTGIAKGTFNDWVSGSATCERLANADAYKQVFEISHIVRVLPYYTDGQITNLQDNILPDLFLTELKYAFDVDFRTVLSNPNKSIKAIYDNVLGSVGWFNQNFNGFDNQYLIESIAYEDSALATSTDGLQISSKTKATITVARAGGVISVGQRAGVFVSYLPSQNEYQNTATTLAENFILDSLYHNEGTAAKVGTGVIKSLTSSIVSDKLVIVAEFEYTTAQQLRLTTASNYLLVVQIADSALSSENSNRVNLIADVNSYQKGAFIEGLFDIISLHYLVNGNDLDNDEGFLSIDEIWNEDSICLKGAFNLDLAKQAFLNSLEFALVAFNTVTNSYFTLDAPYFINTAGAVVSGGVQQINITQSRGYTGLFDENFNRVEVRAGAKVGDLQAYNFLFSQKIRWQDWLNNPTADTVFFDNTKPQNNLNFKSSNYSASNDYQIKMLVIGRTSGIDELGREGSGFDVVEGGNITVKDYGLSSVSYTKAEVATLDPDTLVNLNGAILQDKPTLVESRFSTGSTPSLANKLILHRYERSKQLGNVIPEIEAELSVDGIDLVGRTLLDSSLFERGVAYNFTSRLANPFQVVFIKTTWDTATDGNFILAIITSSGVGTWTLPDGALISAGTLNTASTSIDGNIRSIALSISNFENIKSVDFDNMKLTEKLGLLPITSLNGDLSFRGNPNINDFELGVGAHIVNNLLVSDTGLSSFDASLYGITHAGVGTFQFFNCPNLVSVKSGSGILKNVNAQSGVPLLLDIDLTQSTLQNCGLLLGTGGAVLQNIDFSTGNNTISEFTARSKSFTNLNFLFCEFSGGSIDYRFNSLLTTVSHKNTPQTALDYLSASCNLSALDISMFTVNRFLQVNSNPNLSSFSVGAGSLIGFFLFNNCALTSVDLGSVVIDALVLIDGSNNGVGFPINSVLTQLDALSVSGSGVITLTGTNPAPTGAGLTAKSNLISKGWTVNTK